MTHTATRTLLKRMHAQLAAPRAPTYPGITAISTAYDTWHAAPGRRRPCACAGGWWSAHYPAPVSGWSALLRYALHTPFSESRSQLPLCLPLLHLCPLPSALKVILAGCGVPLITVPSLACWRHPTAHPPASRCCVLTRVWFVAARAPHDPVDPPAAIVPLCTALHKRMPPCV